MTFLIKKIDADPKTLNKLLNSMIGNWALKFTFAQIYSL